MALRLVGGDSGSPNNGSPSVWLEDQDGSIVVQGYKVDDDTTATIDAYKPIPDHETVVRLPARMATVLREACSNGE